MFNEVLAYEVALEECIDDYVSGSDVRIGIATWDANLGSSLFKNVKLTTGSEVNNVMNRFTVASATGNAEYNEIKGTVVKSDETAAKIYFEGASDKWEVTGKMKQEDLTNLVLQGFAVKGSREADNSVYQEDGTYSTGTYYTENKETIYYGHHEGFATVGSWDFKYNTIKNTSGTAGAAKYYVFNADAVNYFRDTNLTSESTDDDTLRTKSEIDFRLVLAEDVLYFWVDDVLSWRIPLTNSTFGGYEAGSLYQLGLAIADEAGEVCFEDLNVKSGDDADLTGSPSFVVMSSDVDVVDNISGRVERTDSNGTKNIIFAGTDTSNYDTQWEVTGTMYRDGLNEFVHMGFVVTNGTVTNRFYGQHQGFVETYPSWTYYNTVSNENHSSYVFNTDIEAFFSQTNRSKTEIDFRAVLVEDTLYVYFDDVISWKIPLTDSKFGGFEEGSSYQFGLTFNHTDVGTVGFKNLKVKSGKEVLTNGDFFIRDAYVLADNDTYYMYGSRFGGSFDVFTSKDLLTWEKQAPCFVHADNSWGIKSDYWAPEVHKYTNPDTNETAYYMFATFRGNQETSTRLRGTAILKADSPLGPFKEWSVDSGDSSIFGPVTPATQQCLDGTLYIEDGTPYMIYCYEYTDSSAGGVGGMYYIQLSNDLKQAVSEPVEMFNAQDIMDYGFFDENNWKDSYVTDGPEIYQASDGSLFLLWSTFYMKSGQTKEQYLQLQVKSDTGKLVGAEWLYDETYSVLYGDGEATTGNPQETNDFDGGHGMIFEGVDGNEYLILHTPNNWYKSLGYGRSYIERSKILSITYDTETKWLKLN